MQRLLPTVNMQPPSAAHDMLSALSTIESDPKSTSGERQACAVLRKAIANLGQVRGPCSDLQR